MFKKKKKEATSVESIQTESIDLDSVLNEDVSIDGNGVSSDDDSVPLTQEEIDEEEYQRAVEDDSIKNATETYEKFDEQDVFDFISHNLGVDDDEVVEVNLDEIDLTGDDLIILENNVTKLKKLFILFRIIFTILIIVACMGIGLFCTLYRIVPEDLKGSSYSFTFDGNEYSIISKNYTPNLDEIKMGDVLFVNKTTNWSPYVYDYEVYTFKNRQGAILNVLDSHGKSCKIQSVQVDYIRVTQANIIEKK